MGRRNILLLKFIYFLQLFQVIVAFTLENHYVKNIYGLEEGKKLNSTCINASEFDQIKADIEELKLQIGETKTEDLPLFDIRYDALPEKCRSQKIPSNCAEATQCTRRSGVYQITNPLYSNDSFLVECRTDHRGAGWTVLQRRQDGSMDFHRTWAEYKKGFGSIDGEFFIGLDKLYALTNYDGPQELLITMEMGSDSVEKYASYSAFAVGNESEKYKLKQLGRYNGTAGDSLRRHIGQKFSTKDQDNDVYEGNCAEIYLGAWWYDKCHASNLNGHYGDVEYAKGLTWHTLTGYQASLQYVQMLVRRRRS